MVERFVEHLSPEDRARLNRFLSHTNKTLDAVLRRVVEDQLRLAKLWERSQQLRHIELTYAEIRAAAITYSEVSVLALAKHQLRGRKIGWPAAESCLLRMYKEGAVIRMNEDEGGELTFRIRARPTLSLVADDDL